MRSRMAVEKIKWQEKAKYESGIRKIIKML